MPTMTVPSEDKTSALEVLAQTATPPLTTLYDLVAAVQDIVGAEDDDLVVATVASLLQAGHVTWRRARTAAPPHRNASRERLQQHPGLLEIGSVKALSKPSVWRPSQRPIEHDSQPYECDQLRLAEKRCDTQ